MPIFPIGFELIFFFLLFIVSVILSIYIPGKIIANYFKADGKLTGFVLSNIIGLVAFSIQAYVFGYLQIRFLTYGYILFFIVFILIIKIKFLKLLPKITIKELVGAKYIFLIILLGSLLQLLAVATSGLLYSDGVRFFGTNEADGVMHLAYIQSIAHHFPPIEPGLSGELLRNYHYWSDMLIAELHRIWKIPVSLLFFQYMPIYLAPLVGLTAVSLIRAWKGSAKMTLWLLFFLYFASDAAYIVIFLIHQKVGFHTPAIDSAQLQFLNMPHVFGKLVFLGSLITFSKWISGYKKMGCLTAILGASLVGFKVYFGIYLAIGIFGVLVYRGIKKIVLERSLRVLSEELLVGLLFLVLSGTIYLPHNLGAGGLVYVYLEWPRSLLGVGSIDWRDWWLRRQVYEQYNNQRNLILLDFLAVIIAFVSIYGTRLIGFVPSKGVFKFLGWEGVILLIPPLLVFQLLGLFTIQSSGGVNVYNFFSVSSVILSIIAAYHLSRLKANVVGVASTIIIISLTLPRTIHEINSLYSQLDSNSHTVISNGELEALTYIRQETKNNTIAQAHPANPVNVLAPYIPFFANRVSYLSGENLLRTHNIPTETRRNKIEEIFESNDIVDFSTKLRQLDIDFIVLRKVPEERLDFELGNPILTKVFENEEAVVLQVYSNE